MKLQFNCHHRFLSPKHKAFKLSVDFDIDVSCTALFGPSGSGKTTIISILAGLIQPQEGCVILDDEVLYESKSSKAVPPEHRSLGVVFQNSLLLPHKKVHDNLMYGRLSRRNQVCHPDFDQTIDLLEIRHLLGRFPGRLSGGEQQRVALGRAILSGPKMLLLDEPLAALDNTLKLRILDYLDEIVTQWGIPALFVTHSRAAVRRTADQVIVLQEGRNTAIGTPDAVLTDTEENSFAKNPPPTRP